MSEKNRFEKMMPTTSLANRAKQAWKASEEARKERYVNQTMEFAEEAKKEFDRRFSDEKITSTEAINPSNVKIVCEDVTFIAQRKELAIIFYVEVKCQYCGKQFLPEYANNVINLLTIGNRLSIPHTCEECKERRKGLEHCPYSIAEIVLEKVREIYNLIKEEYKDDKQR